MLCFDERGIPAPTFLLLDPQRRWFGVQRRCYLSSVDGWLELGHTGSIATLAREIVPTLGTYQFYELF